MSVATKLHKLASPLLYKSGFYTHHWQSCAARCPLTVVLVYHRVLEDHDIKPGMFDIERGVPAGVFEAQLQFMLRHFVPVKASEVLEPSTHRLRFVVTLDDGYEDNLRVAAPILRRLGIPATFYVVSEHVGSDRLFWWEQLAEMVRLTTVPRIDIRNTMPEMLDRGLAPSFALQSHEQRAHFYELMSSALRSGPHAQLPESLALLADILDVRPREEGRDYAMMDWGQLKELVRQRFEIGGHTANHCNLDGADSAVSEREIVVSNRVIEKELGVPVLTFAYPYGHYGNVGADVIEALSATNCRYAFTTVKGVVQEGDNVFELRRTRVNRRYDFACAFNVQESLH